MNTYSKLKAIPHSFFSRDLYRDVRTRWQGIGFSYLLLLMSIFAAIATAGIVTLFSHFAYEPAPDGQSMLANILYQAAGQVPPMSWTAGELSVEAEQPYTITISATEEVSFPIIIDTNADIGVMRDQDKGFLLTRDALHIKQQNGELETRYWKDIVPETYALDQDSATARVDEGLKWMQDNKGSVQLVFGLLLWAGMVIGLVILRIFQALIYGGFGMIFCSLLKAQMSYQTAVRLACVALTPAILIDLVLTATGFGGISLLMSIVLTMGYMFFAVHSTRDIPPQNLIG